MGNQVHAHQDKKSISPAAAALAGLAVGVAAGAAATALSDKKTRQKVGKRMDEANKKARQSYAAASDKIDQISEKAEPKLRAFSQKFRRNVDDAADQAIKASEEAAKKADQVTEEAKSVESNGKAASKK